MKYFLNYVICQALILSSLLGYPQDSQAKKIPNFFISNLDGDRFDSRKHQGAYILSFFYVNCIPCIKEIPQLYNLIKKEFPQTKLLFINPVNEDSGRDIRRFAKKLQVPLKYFYRDRFGSVSKKFFDRKYAFPTIIGVSNRMLLFRHSGLEKEIEKDIREKLN